ncbi:hypothetical protein MSG28_004667 [Choristoneura fumiferana]|uniref:Uncharacterized protein n=1 Tax=Choristoneura fumiferana TaxID=7141 RepID=A0ACC0K6V7_CHOFU|nr:hypothetical protein MSG28_004667 [Choristoneura fumiferana]
MACVAIGCKSRMGVLTESDQRISFHRFPKEPDLRNKWIQNVNRESWTPSPYSRLCSLHFHKSCYRKGFQTKVLHSDAVPTIFTHVPTSLQKGKFKRPRYTRLELCTPSTSMKSHEDELSELKVHAEFKNSRNGNCLPLDDIKILQTNIPNYIQTVNHNMRKDNVLLERKDTDLPSDNSWLMDSDHEY